MVETTTETTETATTGATESSEAPKRPRGFAAMDRELVKAIAQKGGRAAHAAGTAHTFSTEEARIAGAKGGKAPHRRRGPQHCAVCKRRVSKDAPGCLNCGTRTPASEVDASLKLAS